MADRKAAGKAKRQRRRKAHRKAIKTSGHVSRESQERRQLEESHTKERQFEATSDMLQKI